MWVFLLTLTYTLVGVRQAGCTFRRGEAGRYDRLTNDHPLVAFVHGFLWPLVVLWPLITMPPRGLRALFLSGYNAESRRLLPPARVLPEDDP